MFKKQILTAFCLVLNFVVSAQTAEIQKLLKQAEQKVFYNPKEAFTIAEHTTKLAETKAERAESFYLKALSSYVLGNYDLALIDVFQAKETAESAHQHDLVLKCTALSQRIFKFLLLKDKSQMVKIEESDLETALQTEDILQKAKNSLNRNHLDSLDFYLRKANIHLNVANPGYAEFLYYGLKGGFYFKHKQFDSANIFFKKAIHLESNLDNPFLKEQVYRRMAANYLAMDSIVQFQHNSEKVKQLDSQISEIENKASNQVHSLTIATYDKDFNQTQIFYKVSLAILMGLILLIGTVKIVFHVRNLNKLKMFNRMLDYLKKQEEKEIENKETPIVQEPTIESSPIAVETVEVNPHKSVFILKESEEQLLQGLEKFEGSKKFTNKDMSLGKLAAQLGTNTKYLSEVINRNKEKNFNSYINELRINYITNKIKSDPNYLNYKVSYLAEECGFSSHSTFATVFKAIVGVSPSLFVEFVKEEHLKETSKAV